MTAGPADRRSRRPRQALAFLALLLAVLAACPAPRAAMTGTPTPTTSTPPVAPSPARSGTPGARGPCWDAVPPGRYDHVIWIVMENKAATTIRTHAPVISAMATRCAATVGYRAVAHPSLPNYLAMTSGSTHGVTDDADPSRHRITGGSIFSEVSAAHLRWATYAESMPTPCQRTPTGRYAVRHNPATYYTALTRTCATNDQPMGTPTTGPLATALSTGTLPAFTLMVPDLCHDMHDCSVATGDRWLGRWLAAITASRTYTAGRTAVFLTWDEDDKAHANQVLLVVIAPSVRPGTLIRGSHDHLSLLRTTEDLLGLPATLAPAAASLRQPARL